MDAMAAIRATAIASIRIVGSFQQAIRPILHPRLILPMHTLIGQCWSLQRPTGSGAPEAR